MLILSSKYLLLICIVLGMLCHAEAQTEKVYTLNEVVAEAQGISPVKLQAENRRENRYWQYRAFQSNYKPQLALQGTAPDFTRSILSIQQPDGSDLFRERSQFNADLNLALSQTVGLTGGEVFVSSQLSRLQTLAGTNQGVSFLSNPISVGFIQPIFGFNNLKWDKKIEPLRYEESQKRYNEDLEQIAIQASSLFFDLLIAQITLDIAETNLSNNDTIYKIGQGRYNLGKIAENELLQLELNVMNSQQQVMQAQLDLETGMLNLRSFLGRKGDTSELVLIEPKEVPDFEINIETAIAQAKDNREKFVEFKRRRLEAERDVARAKGNNGFNANLVGSFGLTQNANRFGDVYANPQDQQSVRIGFTMPILDWGRQKAQIQTALANEDLVKSIVGQEESDFEREVYVKIQNFRILKKQLISSQKADEIAQRRYEIARQRYKIAKISITDLNIALQEKDQAKRSYLNSLRTFWRAYYEIRQLTLYDFEQNQTIRYQ
ncbi:MAG: TolC family protein [Bernardetiaceae bacterium]|nr:TolC family protein [Bernardetiaceae bacterium]